MNRLSPRVRSRQDAGHLGNPPSGEVGFDGQLEREAETHPALDPRALQERAAIRLEAVGRVVGRQARDPPERDTGEAAHQPLEPRPADLPATAHVATGRDDIVAVLDPGDHWFDTRDVIRQVRHHHHHDRRPGGTHPRLDREADTGPDVVLDETDVVGLLVRREIGQRRQRVIFVEVVTDEQLVARRQLSHRAAAEFADVGALVERRQDDRVSRSGRCVRTVHADASVLSQKFGVRSLVHESLRRTHAASGHCKA